METENFLVFKTKQNGVHLGTSKKILIIGCGYDDEAIRLHLITKSIVFGIGDIKG